MNIAILGFGTVGGGVYDIVNQAQTSDLHNLNITHILIRKGKDKTLPIMCDDIKEIVEDENVDIVIEALGGIEPAHTYILQALRHQKHVVSANKAVIATYFQEFLECAAKHQVHFYYEASTGGGIPWIHALQQSMRIDSISCLHGILNGTSNYILDHMQRNNIPFQFALQQAQELGYAEKDPTADLEGYDLANKIRISASLAFQCPITDKFPMYGIRTITKEDIQFFLKHNLQVRYVAKAIATTDHYGIVVEPTLFHQRDLEANVMDNYNLVTLYGKTIGKLAFYGQGAGKLPTANAILQDCIDIVNNQQHPSVQLASSMLYDSTLLHSDYIVRCNSEALKLLYHIEYTMDETNTYLYIKHINTTHMHDLMQLITACDPLAFMASIHHEEDCLC